MFKCVFGQLFVVCMLAAACGSKERAEVNSALTTLQEEVSEKVEPPQEMVPVDISDKSELTLFVGMQIVARGKVSNTKCPQLNGIDLWELEDHRGETVEVFGVLRSNKVTESDIKEKEEELGGVYANRGPGIFYSLENLTFKLISP